MRRLLEFIAFYVLVVANCSNTAARGLAKQVRARTHARAASLRNPTPAPATPRPHRPDAHPPCQGNGGGLQGQLLQRYLNNTELVRRGTAHRHLWAPLPAAPLAGAGVRWQAAAPAAGPAHRGDRAGSSATAVRPQPLPGRPRPLAPRRRGLTSLSPAAAACHASSGVHELYLRALVQTWSGRRRLPRAAPPPSTRAIALHTPLAPPPGPAASSRVRRRQPHAPCPLPPPPQHRRERRRR